MKVHVFYNPLVPHAPSTEQDIEVQDGYNLFLYHMVRLTTLEYQV